jgi:hypothetical protein
MALRGIVTSDWHLNGMAKIFRNPTEKQIAEIHKPYRYAAEHGISHVFVPGDMSDVPRMDEHTLISIITLLLTYDGHIHTYYQLGNHDVAHTTKTSMDVLKVLADSGFFKTFHLFYQPTLKKIDGINCCFMPFPHNQVLEAPKPPLVFAHIEVAGAIGDNGRPLKHGDDEKFKRQAGDFIFSGHIHQQQFLRSKRFAYCGSLYQKNFGEALPKGFLDFTAKYVNGGKLSVHHEFVNSHPDFTLETKLIESSDDWDTLTHDENIRYKILTGEGVIVPKNIMRDFPNIIYLMGAAKSVKVNMEQEEGERSAELTIRDLPKFNITTGLKRYLKESEMNDPQVKRAKSLVREARAALGI